MEEQQEARPGLSALEEVRLQMAKEIQDHLDAIRKHLEELRKLGWL